MASRNGFRSHGLLNDNQNVLRTFSYYPGVDRPHSVMTDTATYYYATDPTGSVTGLAEYDGLPTVVNHYRYDVWGMPQGTETEGAENPIRFKARWWDEDTELLDFRNRWYDPEIGRFISEDPIGLAGGINVYRFVGNNPVHGWDPYGLFDPDPDDCEYESTTITGPDGIPILQPVQVCVEQGGDAGPSTPIPMPAGPLGSPLPPGGNRNAPNAGPGPRRPDPGELNTQYRNECLVDAGLLVAEAALDAAGAGYISASGALRGSSHVTGIALGARGDVAVAAGATYSIASGGIAVGTAASSSPTSLIPGTNFAQLGAASGNRVLEYGGRILEGSKIIPVVGTAVQGLAAGLSCGRWALFNVLR